MVKLALIQHGRKALAAVTLALGTIGFLAPGAARAEVYYYKDDNGVFHFTETPRPGARPFHLEGQEQATPKKKIRRSRRDDSPRRVVASRRTGSGHRAYDHLIAEYSARYGVNPALVKAVIHAESNFRSSARSRAGARGLMQLMPRTARSYGVDPSQLHDPRHNIRAGVLHLRTLIRIFGSNPRLVAAAYNAGQGNVRRYKGVPPFGETRRYVQKVLRFRAHYSREAALAMVDGGPTSS